jgi:hypothetical protein
MRKFAIVLAALIAASLTTSAEAAKKKAAAKADPAVAANENTRKLFHDMWNVGAPKETKAAKKKGKRA